MTESEVAQSEASVGTQGVRVRPAGFADAEVLLQIQRAASLAAFVHIYPPGRYPFPDDAVHSRWKEELAAPDVTVLISERHGRPIGAVAYAPERFDQLWVVPEEWGSGVAGHLYELALTGLAALGCSVCRLWVLEASMRARRFYERRGWVLDGRRRPTPFPPYPELVGYTLTPVQPGTASAPRP